MKTTIDRQTGRRFRWQYVGGFKRPGWPEHLQTVYRYGRQRRPQNGQTAGDARLVWLCPERLTPAKFAELNPGKVQPPHVNPQDDPELRSNQTRKP